MMTGLWSRSRESWNQSKQAWDELLVDNVKRFIIIIIKAWVRLKGLKAKLMIKDAADEKDIRRYITYLQ